MQALVKVCRKQIVLTEGVILALAKNEATGLEVLKEITPIPEQELEIRGKKVMELWNTLQQGRNIVELLYRTIRVKLQFEPEEFDQVKTNESESKVLLAVLASRPGIDISSDDHNTAFEIALGTGDITIARTASRPRERDNLSHKDPLSRPDDDLGNSSMKLARAILDKDVVTVTMLADKNQVPNLRNNMERLPSLEAADTGDIRLLSELVENGAYMEYQDEWGESLLAVASRGGHVEVVEYLIQRGALLDSKSLFGFAPLHLAAGKGHVDVVRVLLEHGAEIDSRSTFGETPLHLASGKGHVDVVRVLLASGEDVNG